MNDEQFQELIWEKGRELYRTMPWRETTDPYTILVSELMLQQTQVDRVIPKFNAFIEHFPTVFDLAAASLSDVLILWNGLGYNRRAKFLHDAAVTIVSEFDGRIPSTLAALDDLPGIGPNTAAAILVYGSNQPVAFIETNIRSVYFYHYFKDNNQVTDKELLRTVQLTIDQEHPQEWFWALMDYGAYLKKQGVNQISKSAHYKKQAALRGSVRETRGQIITALATGRKTLAQLHEVIFVDERFAAALDGLERDGLIMRSGQELYLTK